MVSLKRVRVRVRAGTSLESMLYWRKTAIEMYLAYVGATRCLAFEYVVACAFVE